MIAPSHVKANVVDLENPGAALPSTLVTDANILYWIFYPNFASLTLTRRRRLGCG